MNVISVRDWMTPDPITISSHVTLPEAFWLMVRNEIRRLLIVDDGVLVGIVTLEDLRKIMPANFINIDPVRVSDMLSKMPVRQVMTPEPVTISVDAPLVEAAHLMLDHNISTLPVMDGENLVGIITESDIFRALVKQLEES